MIPVQNIYYLLSYAWDKLDQGDVQSTDIDSYDTVHDLFARVFANAAYSLLKRGLDRTYTEQVQSYRGIKGKLLLSDSIKQNQLNNGLAICAFDEFNYDTIPNQIIKYTCSRLIRIRKIDQDIKSELIDIYRRLPHIADRHITERTFRRVRLNRSNVHYDFIIKVSKIIFDNISLNENDGTYTFRDFIRNDSSMPRLFESFLRNFYRHKSDFHTVKSERFPWKAQESNSNKLPLMTTDISLISDDRKIIMDAKFYKNALSTYFDKDIIKSSHLYQLYAYLKNEKSEEHFKTEGILIYPTVNQELSEDYIIDHHKVSIVTINLAQPWLNIEQDLLNIIGQSE